MSSSIISMTNKPTDFSYKQGEFHLDIPSPYIERIIRASAFLPGYSSSKNSLSLVSNKKKILISPVGAFYHLFSESVGPLLQQYNLDRDVEIIVDISIIGYSGHVTGATEFSDTSFTGFFIQALKAEGMDVKVVDFSKYSSININNFYFNDHEFYPGDTCSAMNNLFKKYLNIGNTSPHKNIYLSRKTYAVKPLTYINESGEAVYVEEVRLDDENLLEQYFKNLGYETVVPENFSSFQDQFVYMDSVSTIVALTGSGLTNALFMQPGQTLIEINTPLMIPSNNSEGVEIIFEELHHYYSSAAFKRDHTYLAIQNTDRSASRLIEKIENDDRLKSYLDRT